MYLRTFSAFNRNARLLFRIIIAVGTICIPQFVSAQLITTATFDSDSYIFIGTNNSTSTGVSVFQDNSGGQSDAGTFGHFNFAVIEFDNLTGLNTLANGGPQKFLTLTTLGQGAATFGVSVAGADFQTDYLSHPFGPAGANARLQWYHNNIKGDDANFGGYTGGAQHLGIIHAINEGTFSLDVTDAVDAWLEGTTPNFGFGIWGVSTSGSQGNDYDFASIENTGFAGAQLFETAAIPEPSSFGIAALAIGGVAFIRRRKR